MSDDVLPWEQSPPEQQPRLPEAQPSNLPSISKPLNGNHKPPSLSLEGIDLIRGGPGGEGAPKPILANVVSVLRASPEFYNLRYDDFSQRAYRGDAQLQDMDFIDITNGVQRAGVHADVRTVTNAVLFMAQECRFHQVKDYLERLRWDGEERLGKVFVDHGGAPETEIVQAMTIRWHIQAVARVYEPGCKADHMLILEGRQGLKKSWYFDTMAKPWFIDSISDLNSKDAKQELRGVWIVEMAEMNNLRKADANHIKAFLTTRSDHYRDSYGRLVSDYPRQCVLCGTINPGATGYLKDPTGARRFWPIAVKEEIDRDIIAAKRNQLWAEAVARYKRKEPWYLDSEELIVAARDEQDARYESDVWEGPVADYLAKNGKTAVTTTEILTNALFATKMADWGKPEQMRIGEILAHLGWERARRRITKGARPVNVYLAPGVDPDSDAAVPTVPTSEN